MKWFVSFILAPLAHLALLAPLLTKLITCPAGGDVNATDDFGETALIAMARAGTGDVVSRLEVLLAQPALDMQAT
jgi:ankyrin repeat protein